jgi:hypothetical protein
VFYDASRKLILKGVDGVVFVADSQIERMEANIESLENLRLNLTEQGYDLDKLPYVVQYNKRDLPNAAPLDQLQNVLNPTKAAEFEACATSGVGVFDTLKAVAKAVLTELKRERPPRRPFWRATPASPEGGVCRVGGQPGAVQIRPSDVHEAAADGRRTAAARAEGEAPAPAEGRDAKSGHPAQRRRRSTPGVSGRPGPAPRRPSGPRRARQVPRPN